ncbi:MAG: hypothetical protein N2449_08290 [Bacteroidales bacterium]|nr:hypothetical protein [Bacteroidales bacterium]
MKYFFIIISLLNYLLLFSQEPIILKEITVYDKLTKSIDYYTDSNKINCYKASSLANILSSEPSIVMKQYGTNNLSLLSIRGTQPQQNIVLWNNMPLFSSLSGQLNLTHVYNINSKPLFINYGIKTLENISGAFGGTIHISTAIDYDEQPFTHVYTQFESLNNYFFSFSNLTVFKNVKTKNTFQYVIQNNCFEYENNAVLPTLNVTQKAQYSLWQINNEWYYQKKQWRLNLSNELTNCFNEIPPLMTSIYKARHEEWTKLFNFQSVANIFYNQSFHLTLGYRLPNFSYRLNHSYNETSVTSIYTNSHEPVYFSSLKIINYQDSDYIAHTNINYLFLKGIYFDKQNSTYFNKKQYRFEASEQLRILSNKSETGLILGILVSDNSYIILPSLSFRHKLSSSVEIGQTVGRNARIPFLNELYFIPGGNPDLLPEIALQMDGFVQYTYKKLKIKLKPYFSNYTNWILWQPTNFGYWESKNIRKINIYGLENMVSWNHIIASKFKLLHIVKYSLIKSTGFDNQYSIKHLPYIPKQTISYSSSVRYNAWQLYHDITCFSTRYPLIYDQTIILKPYTLWNIMILYHTNKFHIGLGIDNILNTTYQSILWRAMPGRVFKINFSIKFASHDK